MSVDSISVLHVIDPGSPGGGACTLQLLSEPLARLNSVRQDALIVGNQDHEALARECGVEPIGRITAPRNHPVLAGFGGNALRSFLDEFERARGRYDVIHTWTARSALLASIAAPDHQRLGTITLGPVNNMLMHAFGSVLEHQSSRLLATSVGIKRDYLAIGVPEEQIDILRPAVHPEAVEMIERTSLRRRWGVKKKQFVIALLAEPVTWCDAMRATRAIAVALEAGRDCVLVVHPKASRLRDAMEFLEPLGLADRMILEDEIAQPWKIVRGIDAALLFGDDSNIIDLAHRGSAFSFLIGGGRASRPMPGVMPALWAMAAGAPVIAEATPSVLEFVEDGATGLLVDHRDVNQAADRIVRLMDDHTIAGRIGAAAHEHIHEHYHVSAFCVRLRDVYERVVERRPVRVISDDNDPVVETRAHARADVEWVQHVD